MRLAAATALLPVALLAACDLAELDPTGPAPVRPPVTVAKEVTMVSADELVGAWRCDEVNPYPDQLAVTTTLVLQAGGALRGEALLPMAQATPGAGDLLMTTTGDWRVAGDRLIVTGTETDVAPANGSTGGMSAAMASAAAFFGDRAADSEAEIFRITATDLVMRDLTPDAPTVACVRQAPPVG